MFKGSRGVRLQYRKSDGSYDYVQPIILPNGERFQYMVTLMKVPRLTLM